MRILVIPAENYPQALLANQMIVEYLTKLGYTAEYVPDNQVLATRISRIYNMVPRNSPVPDIFIVSHRYFLKNTTSKLRNGQVLKEIIQGCIIDVNRAYFSNNFNIENTSTVAQAELYETDDLVSDSINEVFTKVIGDIFKR
jgi:hypothetical protein